jgi:hypothetical protein
MPTTVPNSLLPAQDTGTSSNGLIIYRAAAKEQTDTLVRSQQDQTNVLERAVVEQTKATRELLAEQKRANRGGPAPGGSSPYVTGAY